MPSPCSLCSASCCTDLYITVTIFDIIRIMDESGKEHNEFSELYPLRLLNFDNDTVLEFHDRKYMEEHILCIKSHPCFFLAKNKCSIYPFSPSVCKAFPKGIDGKWKTRLCPGVSGFLFRVSGFGAKVRGTYAWELDTYKGIVAEWNKSKGKKSDCMEFLLRRAKEELARCASAQAEAGEPAQAASRTPR